jgi:hypothetical protein
MVETTQGAPEAGSSDQTTQRLAGRRAGIIPLLRD